MLPRYGAWKAKMPVQRGGRPAGPGARASPVDAAVLSIWDFPKGLVEVGEDPLHTALREVREETTLDDLHFPWGHVFIETGPYSRGKIARYYLAKTHRENVAILPNPETGIPEHVEYRWFSPRDALRVAGPRVRLVVDWALGQVHK